MRFKKLTNIQIPLVTGKTLSHHISDGIDYAAYGRLIQRCTDHRLLRQGKQLHARLVLSSVTLDNFLASKLITFYSKTNNLFEAHKVFDEIPNKNTFSWNALLIGYSMNNRCTDTLNLFRGFLSSSSMYVKPDHYTVTCVLKALSSLGFDSGLAKMFHCFVTHNGFDSDVFVVNALITFYCRCDDIVSARNLFDATPEKDLVSWNSMITGYSQGGFYEKCKQLYLRMLGLEGLRPNEVTMVSVLQACGQSEDLGLGMEVHRFVTENQIEMDLSVCNSLIAMYAKCGSLDYAKALFGDMSEKDEITYGSLISGYMNHGFFDKAMNLFREMKRPGLSTWNAVISGQFQNKRYEVVVDIFREMQLYGFRPNTVTLSNMLPTLSHLSNLKGGREIHAYAIRNGFDRNIYVATAVIDTYGKLGNLCWAQRVFDRSEKRSLILWTSIISAYAAHGDVTAALHLFREMIDEGTRPDSVTFTSLLSACAHSGMVDEAWRLFNSMLPRYGIEPSMEHFACMVDVLSRALKLSEAMEFIKNMPFEPSAKVWGALLNGAWVSGDVEIGRLVCDQLFEIEPENIGNYIVMANLYSQAGRWEEAERVREKLTSIGVKKIAGGSWLQTPRGLQSFIAKDVSNEKTDETYATVGGLSDFDERRRVSLE